MSKDEQPWLQIAKDVLANVYDDKNESYIESLWIGLHNINDRTCIEATEQLRLKLVEFRQGYPSKAISKPHVRFVFINRVDKRIEAVKTTRKIEPKEELFT